MSECESLSHSPTQVQSLQKELEASKEEVENLLQENDDLKVSTRVDEGARDGMQRRERHLCVHAWVDYESHRVVSPDSRSQFNGCSESENNTAIWQLRVFLLSTLSVSCS